MSGMTSERLRAITYDMNTRPNVTITDRYHAEELLAEVKRLRAGIEVLLESVEDDDHTPGCGGEPTCGACWAAGLDSLLHPNALLTPPTEGEAP